MHVMASIPNGDLDLVLLPSNVEPVESLQHHLFQSLKQNNDNYFRGAYVASVQDDIVSNDFEVKRSESECLVVNSCGVIIH